MSISHYLQAKRDGTVRLEVTPESAGWRYLSFQLIALQPGETFTHETGGDEVALTSLEGSAHVDVAGEAFEFGRKGVFEELAQVLYVPPHKTITLTTTTAFQCALGGAPAEGKYPTRLFTSSEMKVEQRGGGAARRQVNHLLAHPLPAERLILYDAYLPGGMWGGIPPHTHDGYMDSPYLEEVYYYRITPEHGFGFHRNFRLDTDFDEVFTMRDGGLVLVTQGFHPVAAAPGSNIYFLNYLAGDLVDDARKTPPFNDPQYAWTNQDWGGGAFALPMFEKQK